MAAQTTLGTTIGRHRIARLLGGGTVGRVFACKPAEREQLVAIKMLRTKHARLGDAVLRQRSALERIESPHVARILDVSTFNNAPFVVMELVEGESLKEHLERGILRTIDALALMRGVVLGLQAAWAHGIAHGDVRPANVLLPRGEVRAPKLVDFLLAPPVPGTEAVRGSPAYLAPELLVGTPPDALSDLYSVGCMMHEALTGQPPFTGSDSSVLHAHASTPAPTLAQTMPGAPQGLVDLVDRLLEKDRAKRLKTHGAVLVGIERALQGQALAAPPGPDIPMFDDVDIDSLDAFDPERTDEVHTSPARTGDVSNSGEVARERERRQRAAAKPMQPLRSLDGDIDDDDGATIVRSGIASLPAPIPSAEELGLVLTPVLPPKPTSQD